MIDSKYLVETFTSVAKYKTWLRSNSNITIISALAFDDNIVVTYINDVDNSIVVTYTNN